MNELEGAVRRASERQLPRAELSAAIVARLEQLGAPPESIAAATKIALPKSVVVVAGQQPVLFGGPGLVWAKADDAARIAREIEKNQGVPAVAVFWNASEDHDHAEVDHVAMELAGEVETLRLSLPGDRRMLSRVPVPETVRALLDLVRAKLPAESREADVLAAIEPLSGDTMGSWFSRIVMRRMGVVVVEPETLRSFAKSVVDLEIARPGEIAASVRRAEDAAEARGETRPLALVRSELFFLVDDAGGRLRVERRGEAWHVEDGRVLTTPQMLALPPSAFSWNVATRVLAQDVALPVAVSVCGPSEIRYCALLAEAHSLLGVPQPALRLRSTWVFVTARAERLCRELNADPWVVACDGATAFGTTTAPTERPEVVALRDAVARLPATGSAAVQRRRAALVHGAAQYAEAVRRDAVEGDAVTAQRRARLLALLRPGGAAQDRTASPLLWLTQIEPQQPVRVLVDPATGARTVVFPVASSRSNTA